MTPTDQDRERAIELCYRMCPAPPPYNEKAHCLPFCKDRERRRTELAQALADERERVLEEAAKAVEALRCPDSIPHAISDVWHDGVGAAAEAVRSLKAPEQPGERLNVCPFCHSIIGDGDTCDSCGKLVREPGDKGGS